MPDSLDEITMIRAGALGDVVLTLPAVSALRSAFPAAWLRVIGYPTHWQVAGDLVDEVRSIDTAAMTGLLTNRPAEPLRRALGSSDLVVAWTSHDPTSTLRASGVPRTVYAPPTPPPGLPAARWFLQSVAGVLAEGREKTESSFQLDTWRLSYSDAELLAGSALLEKLGLTEAILVHPGAGAAWKRWPAARFADTGMTLLRHGLRVALLAGPADDEAIAAVQRHAAQPFPVIPPRPIRDLGAILSQVPAYLGNDSGVTQLAGASGAPTVALFGPTDPATWKPLGWTTTLRHCMASASPPGGIRVCDDPTCLEAITVDEVVGAIERVVVQNSVENP